MRSNRNLFGIASLTFGVMLFSTQDAIIKSISHDHAVTLAMAIRCIVALPLLLILVHFECGIAKLRSPLFWALVMRGGILLVAYTTYYMALPALPLAEAIALFFAAPIIVTILSVPMLGEKVSGQSWAAIALGFIGVLVILQPGTALFNPAALFSLVSAATYALAMIIARRLGVSEPATVMAFYQNAVYFLGAIFIAGFFSIAGIDQLGHPSLDFLVRSWAWPNNYDLFLMGICGAIAAVAMSLLTNAYRMADANLVTVFEYTGMFWAPLWGFLFFSEIPRWTTLTGLGLILVAGLISVKLAAAKPSQSGQAPSTAR
ncbi:MAG: DMT family transporter [Aestuariivirga sp.]|nr:DMT family transporter [Aestuariivirga sp.]